MVYLSGANLPMLPWKKGRETYVVVVVVVVKTQATSHSLGTLNSSLLVPFRVLLLFLEVQLSKATQYSLLSQLCSGFRLLQAFWCCF